MGENRNGRKYPLLGLSCLLYTNGLLVSAIYKSGNKVATRERRVFGNQEYHFVLVTFFFFIIFFYKTKASLRSKGGVVPEALQPSKIMKKKSDNTQDLHEPACHFVMSQKPMIGMIQQVFSLSLSLMTKWGGVLIHTFF